MSKKMSAETNAVNWFEIPVKDISRAKKFYERIFEVAMTEMEMMGMKMAMFPYGETKAGGALVQSQTHIPSATGAVIYLNANPDLQNVLNKIEKEGGKITMPKTLIDEQTGYMAFFTDTEGNNVGLHSNQ